MKDALFEELRECHKLYTTFNYLPAADKRAFLALLPRHLKDLLFQRLSWVRGSKNQSYATAMAGAQGKFTEMSKLTGESLRDLERRQLNELTNTT